MVFFLLYPTNNSFNELGPLPTIELPPSLVTSVEMPPFQFQEVTLDTSPDVVEQLVPVFLCAVHPDGVDYDTGYHSDFGAMTALVCITEFQRSMPFLYVPARDP